MRDAVARCIVSGICILALGLCAACAFAQSESVKWGTYHLNGVRTGQNTDSEDITNPASIGLVWTFPRDVATSLDEAVGIVDDVLDPSLFVPDAQWRGYSSPLAYANHYFRIHAVSKLEVEAGRASAYKVVWRVPKPFGFGAGLLPPGNYKIAVWVPPITVGSNETNTTTAEYTVYDDEGATTIRFNQQDGGYWKTLSSRHFSFTGKGPSTQELRIELTNATSDTAQALTDAAARGANITVSADAIQLIPATGQEIYSSATSAELQWRAPDPDGGDDLWSGPTPFVFVGTVESPLSHADDAADSGAVYAINSVTPITYKLSSLDPNDSEYKRLKKLSEYLGTTLWRYPHGMDSRDPALALRLPEEGPIEGGIYSSPTLAYIQSNPDDATTRRLACFVAAKDRQVYALDAHTGELLWKGPGVTVGDENALDEGTWNVELERPDAFGARFQWAECADASTAGGKITWSFSDSARQSAGEPAGGGWAYSVYAWIPVHSGADLGGKARANDATYTITYRNNENALATAVVTVDQALPSNQGKWVQLGTSYFNVQQVVLSNGTNSHKQEVDEDDVPTGRAADYAVVADAVMIVPQAIQAFTYSSVVTDAADPTSNANSVFAANTEGRLVAFNAVGRITSKSATVRWVYPSIRSSMTLSPDSPADAEPLGQIGASPAYFSDRLVIATSTENGSEGSVVCLRNVNGTTPVQDWVFPNAQDEQNQEFPAGFTSSPAIDTSQGAVGAQLFIGSTDGSFYCLHANGRPNASQLKWKYPDPDVEEGPTSLLSRVNYSTPAYAVDSRSTRRVWVGGSDGRIYSFLATESVPPGQSRRLGADDDNNQYNRNNWYVEPSVMSPIQASIAVDKTRPVMYVGDMRGTLSWFDATTGGVIHDSDEDTEDTYHGWRTEGELFSSPNITTVAVSSQEASWVYTGCSDGRVYAFSHAGGAWGGEWNGGNWPFEGDPTGSAQKIDTLAPDTEVQFDIFPGDFYQQSLDWNPEPRSGDDYLATGAVDFTADPDGDWPDEWIVGEEMKLLSAAKLPQPGTNKDKDDVIDEELRKLALLRRGDNRTNTGYVMGKLQRTKKVADEGPNDGIYFEWGERINLVLWNLPAAEYLYGTDLTSKRNNIRFVFTNASTGSQAGRLVNLSGDRKILKEYTVLDKDKETSKDIGGVSVKTYEPLRYIEGNKEVKRCYMLAQIDIDSRRSLSPGPGWILSAEIKRKSSDASDASIIPEIIPLARLELQKVECDTHTTSGQYVVPRLRKLAQDADETAKVRGEWDYTQQPCGINNPLALAVGNARIAWGSATNNDGTTPDRYHPDAHINGNPPSLQRRNAPVLDLGLVPHGSASVERVFGVLDRSAVSLPRSSNLSTPTPPAQSAMSPFRVNADELRWRGYEATISTGSGRQVGSDEIVYGLKLPWEQGPGSVDYPNINRQRQAYRKLWDDKDPSRERTELPPLYLTYDRGADEWNVNYPSDAASVVGSSPKLRPESVYMSVNVPRFQPGNMTRDANYTTGGYSRTLQAFIDSNNNGAYDSGVSIIGRPTSYQEAFREFRLGVSVPPDPRLEVEEQLVDIGRAPHGMGEHMLWDFNPFINVPDVQKWFKKITVKNAGNVNLANIRIGKNGTDANGRDWTVELFSDQANPMATLPGYYIVSSLDGQVPPFNEEPFVTNPQASGSLGYVLSKPLVGEPDPTELSIPDRRKWERNYGSARLGFRNVMSQLEESLQWPMDSPLPVKVSVIVPLTQPVGTYGSWDPYTKNPLSIPVYSDTRNASGSPSLDYGEPFAEPSFQLKVAVRENQLTGPIDEPHTLLPEIDLPETPPFYGDASPAAFRDPSSGAVHLFWSSNRVSDESLLPQEGDTAFANAPWFIQRARLAWHDSDGWKPFEAGRMKWWETPETVPYLPENQWPSVLLPQGSVMEWQAGGGASGSGLKSVRHHSPVVFENWDRINNDAGASKRLQWLAWAGTADVSIDTGKIEQEHRLFYTDISHGEVGSGASQSAIHSIDHDPTQVKRSPSLSVFGPNGSSADEQMWMFWQGGESGKWSIYFSINKQGPDFAAANAAGRSLWSDDMRLRTPDCLSSVGSPNALHRSVWGTDKVAGVDLFDIVYSGVSKLTQNSDVLLTRYAALDNASQAYAPNQRALPLPRVYAEKLQRDPKFGFFTSAHLAWMRPAKSDFAKATAAAGGSNAQLLNLLGDHAGRNEHAQFQDTVEDWFNDQGIAMIPALYEVPYVRVVLPAGFTLVDGTELPPGTIVSATDGSIWTPGSNGAMEETVAAAAIIPEVDDATGIYTYRYPQEDTREILGEMLVDYSAGIVRFTRPLPERRDEEKGIVLAPSVLADYTPQTMRLTTDLAGDSSPRSFIEHTAMNSRNNPGLGGTSGPNSVGRLWTFWRKASTGTGNSTIYYSTYRVGVDLGVLKQANGDPYPAIPMNSDGSPAGELLVAGNIGAWEVDRTGRRIYFTQSEERYRSLAKSGALPSAPSPITVIYEVGGTEYTVNADDVCWISELPEQALLGYAADGSVNEGSIYAFADPNPKARGLRGTFQPLDSSKIWVFWTSTRSGTSDLFWETLSPDFAAR